MPRRDSPDENWEEKLRDLFEDLEQQAQGLHLAERDAEVIDRSRSEYSQVAMASRLHASVGGTLALRVLGIGRLEGMVLRAGVDWCLLRSEPTGQETILRLAAITNLRGLSDRAVSEPARSVLARLSLGSALRGVADSGAPLLFQHIDGDQQHGVPVRVGADFVEIRGDTESVTLERGRGLACSVLPFAALAAVRRS